MIGLYEKRAGYYFKKRGGVCGIRRGKLATKKTGNIIGDKSILFEAANPIPS